MDNVLLAEEIKAVNRRYVLLCLRVSETNEVDACIKLNASLPFIRAVKKMTMDQLFQLVDTPVCLMKPAVTDQTILQFQNIDDGKARALFLHSASSTNDH